MRIEFRRQFITRFDFLGKLRDSADVLIQIVTKFLDISSINLTVQKRKKRTHTLHIKRQCYTYNRSAVH